MKTCSVDNPLQWSAAIPVRIVSVANMREAWQARHRRAKAQRMSAAYSLIADVGKRPVQIGERSELRIKLTRYGGRRMDSDNLQAAFKAIRDGVADWLDMDDGSPLLHWEYEQAKGPHGARVEITLIEHEQPPE
jgi:hypothetical protein